MNDTNLKSQLYRLALLYNVQTAFYGVRHRRHTAPVESLLAVLSALGAPLASLSDVPQALREKKLALKRQMLEPVTVVWEGELPQITVTLPGEIAGVPYSGNLELESGEKSAWKWQAAELPVFQSTAVENQMFVTTKLTLPQGLPPGYHRFTFEAKGRTAETLVIAAPRRAFSPPDENNRGWGAFLPLYGLKTQNDWGSGDYSGLGALVDWVVGEGGSLVGTLPLLPVFLDEPYDPSPYAPVSRLLWNEFYIDVTRAREFSRCVAAQEIVQSAAFRAETEKLRSQPLVDYRRVMSLKRSLMEEMCHYLLQSGNQRLEAFQRFTIENPVAVEYAQFRAVMEKQKKPWGLWPPRLRDGDWRETEYEENIKNYHLYAQWLAQQQIKELAEKSRQKGIKLYFDLPLGIHPDGYDAWRYRDVFAKDVSAGAPPDPVFTTGQNWGFPPLHPDKIREQGYQYLRNYLHHHLQYAEMLRIDHVMGLHRLYWIPRGIEATQGVYVRYRAEELYAILALESHRHRSIIIGEDLGIVPGYVRPAMARHGLHRMYILYYELADSAEKKPRPIPRHCIAGLNTHDMPPFASFWEGADIPEKMSLNLLDEKQAAEERESRQATRKALGDFLIANGFLKKAGESTRAALKACLAFLSASAAHTVLINLEDLWLETKAQNLPGVGDRFPSFQRKARYALEEFCRMSEVSDILREINTLRKRTEGQGK